MKTTLITLAAICGLAAASIPVSAEDVFVGGRVGGVGVGVDVGGPGYYRDRDYDRDDRVYRRTEGFDRYEGVERCRTTVIRRDDGSVRKIRRCRD
jgi:hypothetical protein